MAGRVKKAAAPKKKGAGYKMPDPIPTGEVIKDTLFKKEWRIGPSIGVGGFGEIYSASDNTSKSKEYPYAIKIEPHENGPLFVEINFYLRNANKDDIAKFMQTKKLSNLGMPTFFGRGTHTCKGVNYRYLVLEKYGRDVWSLFNEAGKTFSATTVFQLGLQMLDVLEYIHSRGYVHADLKGANMLLSLKKKSQVYLVDFGLATRIKEGDFKPDPKSAHNGTIEYTSRDAHLGEPTMRGDLEILGYNMLHWLTGKLPWEKAIKVPKTVQTLKETFMKDVRNNIKKEFTNVPDSLIKFFEYINTLKPKQVPDYKKCRDIFEAYLKTEGKTKTSALEFSSSKAKSPSKAKANKRNVIQDDDDEGLDDDKPLNKQNSDVPKKRGRKPKDKPEILDDDEEGDEVDAPLKKQNGNIPKRKGRKPKAIPVVDSEDEVNDDDDVEESDEDEPKQNGVSKNQGKKPKPQSSPDVDSENKVPDSLKPKKKAKRKSSEPAVLVNVKKIKLNPQTPPAKKNHANIAVQTSIEKRKSPRQSRHVSFESPICEIIGDKKKNNSINSSGDIFDDSFEEVKISKRKLISEEEVTVKRIVKKKITTTKKPTQSGRSYKDAPTIVNGRSPPK